uniref:NADH-ubiquinone oxidoreductase chain 3 n=1 Tax=Pista cristata TaxID=279652 RepID=B3TK04_9ANNE|nr:NADH dehydrogenase subunit 3 [Pista cristata]
MLYFFFNLTLSILVPSLIIISTIILSWRTDFDREKFTPFECGFDPKNSARLPFSLRFFLLAVIFLVFDIEIALLMPIPLCLMSGLSISIIPTSFLFFLILLLGLLHEWHEGSLDWSS